MQVTTQPKLFENPGEIADIEKVLLYALGDFQARGKRLVDRELAFDRLRGAFVRAFHKFGLEELPDQTVAEGLRKIGARVIKVPSFVAKHPYRVMVSRDTAQIAKTYFTGLSKATVAANKDD